MMSSETFYMNESNRDYVDGNRDYPNIEIKGRSPRFLFLGLLIFVITVAYILQIPKILEQVDTSPSSEASEATQLDWIVLIGIPCASGIFFYGTLISEIEWRKTRDKWKRLAKAKRTTIIDTKLSVYNHYSRWGKEQDVSYEFISPKSGNQFTIG